jgi:D-glycero-D-manno-heptose 1,7-bisphosphate phosphatase
VFFCPHAAEDNCLCRKPLPGLFLQLAERLGVDLRGVPAVGDGLRDVQAAVAAGCEPHLLLTGKALAPRGQALPAAYPAQTQVHEDLAAFADHLIARSQANSKEAKDDEAARGALLNPVKAD